MSNESGEASCSWHVNVTGLPGPPGGPMNITGVDKHQVVLGWKTPNDDGGAMVTHYSVEKMDKVHFLKTAF